MRTIAIFITTIITSFLCGAQDSGVEYYFFDSVNIKINEYLSHRSSENPDIEFYLTVYTETEQERSRSYTVVIGSYSHAGHQLPMVRELLDASTGRYYNFDGDKIPILFDYDFTFVVWGKDEKGRPVRRYLIQDGYSIEFEERSGKIIRFGY